MPGLVLAVIIGAIIIWFTISFAFPTIGKFCKSMWENAVGIDENKNEKGEKENGEKENGEK